jgi:hypothetical protein
LRRSVNRWSRTIINLHKASLVVLWWAGAAVAAVVFAYFVIQPYSLGLVFLPFMAVAWAFWRLMSSADNPATFVLPLWLGVCIAACFVMGGLLLLPFAIFDRPNVISGIVGMTLCGSLSLLALSLWIARVYWFMRTCIESVAMSVSQQLGVDILELRKMSLEDARSDVDMKMRLWFWLLLPKVHPSPNRHAAGC